MAAVGSARSTVPSAPIMVRSFRSIARATPAPRCGGSPASHHHRALPVALTASSAGLTVVMVPGLLADASPRHPPCSATRAPTWRPRATAPATSKPGPPGQRDQRRNHSRRDPRHAGGLTIILVTHSKGTVDSLLALATYPDLADKVVALVSVAGAVNGSPLADIVPDWIAQMAESIALPECPRGHGVEAADSLRRSERLTWLATHTWPASVRTYSLVAVAGPDDMSAVLRPFAASSRAPSRRTTAWSSPPTPSSLARRCSAMHMPTIWRSPCRSAATRRCWGRR